MTGLDTNVLVRYLAQDDPLQARRVDAFVARALEEETLLHIDDIVLCETVWVLRAAYRLGKERIADALDRILSTSAFTFDDRDLLRAAALDYRAGTGDFSDYVIGRRNVRAGCDHTVTFDRSLGEDSRFELL